MKWRFAKRKFAKIHQKQLKSLRNWRYYQKHRAEILKKRKEKYELYGK